MVERTKGRERGPGERDKRETETQLRVVPPANRLHNHQQRSHIEDWVPNVRADVGAHILVKTPAWATAMSSYLDRFADARIIRQFAPLFAAKKHQTICFSQ